MTNEAGLAKLASIERCLQRIRTVTGGDPETVENLDVEEIVVLNLQRAIQAVIDLSAHVISGRHWGLPDSLKAHFRILIDQRVIGAELGARLQAMVGFRNIAVHEYDRLDRDIVKAILTKHLVDFDEFADAIKALLAA